MTAAQGRVPVTAAHRGSGAHVPCARLEPCSGRMASRTGVRRGEQRRSKNKTMKGCHAEPPCETLAVQDIEKATNSWQIDQSTWLVHAARRFGNRANSGESPSFASPPRDGFAIVDRFAPVCSCLESSVGLLCRPPYCIPPPLAMPQKGGSHLPPAGDGRHNTVLRGGPAPCTGDGDSCAASPSSRDPAIAAR